MRSVFIAVGVVVVIALVAVAGTFQVQETEYAIVARFGDPRRVIDEAGLHFKWPPPIETLLRIDRRTNVLDPEPGEYLTSDKKNILVSNFLVWSVADPLRYLVSLTDKTSAEARLTDIMRSEVGTALGAYPLSALVSTEEQEQTMADVMRDITGKAAQRASDSFGVHIAAVRIKRLNFPPQNKQAVFRRMEAERQRIARLYRSEGEEEAEKIRAQADREEAVLLNEARRQAEEIRGEADAEATRIYAEAFGQDPEFFEFVRSLEAYQNIISESSTIVVPSDAELLKVLQTPGGDGATDGAPEQVGDVVDNLRRLTEQQEGTSP
ncbi:MAG: protease modulator HflC [Candidatus Tectomicrobia bacterium]|nr:protease modulator HflC [Candidatus Tectomicrobia bacterium]